VLEGILGYNYTIVHSQAVSKAQVSGGPLSKHHSYKEKYYCEYSFQSITGVMPGGQFDYCF